MVREVGGIWVFTVEMVTADQRKVLKVFPTFSKAEAWVINDYKALDADDREKLEVVETHATEGLLKVYFYCKHFSMEVHSYKRED